MTQGAEGQRRQQLNTRGILILVLISLLLVPLVYWVMGWQAAFVLLLLIPWIAYWRFIPSRFFRVFLYAYLIYAIAFASATWIQSQLAQNPRLIAYINDHRLVSFFLGGEHSFAKQVLFSIVAGIFLGVLAVNIPLWAIVFASSEWVLALHRTTGVDRQTAIRHVRSLILGMQYPWMIVDDGKVIQSQPAGVLPAIGGPGLVVIRPAHAVVFERAGRITRVSAPGLIRAEQFERVRDVVELKPMWHSETLENILTKDRIPLRITFGVGFQIEPKSEVDKRSDRHVPGSVALTPVLSDDVYTVYEGSVRRAVFEPEADWKITSYAAAENALRDIVATYDLDQIFRITTDGTHSDRPHTLDTDQRTIHDIEQKILEGHRKAAPTWGVHIRSVDIKVIELPQEAQEQMLEWWRAGWQRRVALSQAKTARKSTELRGQGEAEAIAHIEDAKRQAQEDLILSLRASLAEIPDEQLSPDTIVLVDRFLGILGRLSSALSAGDTHTAVRYIEALEKMATESDTTMLVVGEESARIPRQLPPGKQRNSLP